jgi:protein-S-isoprenylcysteine O-methyltransferase Ste14
MDVAKWLGIVAVSVVMGMVVAGLAELVMPSIPILARVCIEIVGALIILRPMIEVGRIADTIERHHGKQFD